MTSANIKPKLIAETCKSYWKHTITHKDVKSIRNCLAYARAAAKKLDSPEQLPDIIAKCIFISLLGENTDFAQIHAVNLMGENKFSSKFLAYMAAQVFIDQSGDIVVLLTQTVLKDLEHYDPKIVCLACKYIANTKVIELLQACAQKIKKLLEHPDSYVVKNAAAAATRIVKECPELYSQFINYLPNLLGSKQHCIANIAANLTMQIYPQEPKTTRIWEKLSKIAIDYITTLSKANSLVSQYQMGGLEDHFLQINLLKLLGVIAQPSKELDELFVMLMNTVQLKRAAGRSLLLQLIQVCQKLAKSDSVRKAIINHIGKLLYLHIPTVVYSALSAFTKILYRDNEIVNRTSAESEVLSRHKDIIIKLLEHPDPTIRRRALDLITALVNSENIETLLPQIIKHIKLADADFRHIIIFKVFYLVQNFAPSMKWNIDCVLQLMIQSENYISNEIIIKFTEQIGKNPRIQEYVLEKLDTVLQENTANQPIVQVASFIIGEFAYNFNENFLPTIAQIAKMPQTKKETINYILTAVAKYSFRFGIVDETIFAFFDQFLKSDNIEIQQRAGELTRILQSPEASEELLCPILYEGESDDEPKITPYNSDLSVVMQSMQKIKASQSMADPLILKRDSVLSILLEPVQIVQPKGSHEVLMTNDIVIYFEISKNPSNLKQFAIRSSIFNRVPYKTLSAFRIKYGVPVGWMMQCKDQNSHELHPDGKPLQHVIMLENKGVTPLSMKVLMSYNIEGQNMNCIENLKPINHLVTAGF